MYVVARKGASRRVVCNRVVRPSVGEFAGGLDADVLEECFDAVFE